VIHLDTNVVVFLFRGEISQLSSTAKAVVNSDQLVISPLVLLELQLIGHRWGSPAPDEVLRFLRRDFAIDVSRTPLLAIVEKSLPLTWTREPMDRLIVGNALADEAKLLTKDRNIRAHFPGAVW
jgi:PIN domain nuclease of toxin-antitoxin system